MSRLSNAQALLFTEIAAEEARADASPSTTLTGWFGTQQLGQAKAQVTDSVVANRGVVTHTVGDALLSSFSDPSAAMNAALDIQRKIAQGQGKSSGMVVRTRIGMAYGPVRVIAGKVSGDAVAAAGVLLEKSQPGEILLDGAMHEALKGAKDTTFEACGPFDGLKAFRVLVPGGVSASVATTVTRAQAGPSPTRTASSPVPKAPPPAAPTAASVAGAAHAPGSLVLRFRMVEQRFGPADAEVTLGRGKDNTIVVPSMHVSRKHARIAWEGMEGPFLFNLSNNGSCVQFEPSGRVQTCQGEKILLDGSGSIALAGQFGQAAADNEVVHFKVVRQ
ncbi:MAG TPA: FHA domain-containing protein [Burkholderiales bacterium]